MLSLSYIRENQEEVIERLSIRNFKAEQIITEVITIDSHRRQAQIRLDALLAELNLFSKKIGDAFKQGKKDEANQLKDESSTIKETSKTLQTELSEIEKALEGLLLQIPNMPHTSVGRGTSEKDNQVMEEGGTIPTFDFEPNPHWELASQYHLIDFEAGNKITGAGFPIYTGKGAKLQRALINFFLEEATAAGYEEVIPPQLVNEASALGTGQLPDKEGQMYYINSDNLYLIPTAEVPITNIYRNSILKKEELPIKMVGYSSCYRREAGSYGKDVRGLNRLHQFDKVEIVQIVHPDTSYTVLDEMVAYVKSLLIKLALPYRIVKLCGGDLGFTSALTYDFEVYSAAQQKWLEVSSVSNFEYFQTNRMKIRYKEATGKPQLVHTLNGSALALPRIVAALLENNQTQKGINIPKELIPYTGFNAI